jgi:hypothetical protein
MDRVGLIIGKALQRRGLFAVAQAALVVERSRQYVAKSAPGLSAILTPVRVEEGVLILTARHAVALQEGQALLPGLLESLKQDFGPSAPKTARLVRE